MKMNRLRYALALLFLVGQWVYAQDTIPVQPKPDRHSEPIYSSEEMTRLMEFIAVDSPMPDKFLQTEDNVLTDPTASLAPFFAKLKRLDRPVRIVHIGDSHVRGHVFPYVMRRCLEDDFGMRAVEDLPVSYQTSGLAVETGREGVVYHILGVNGATCATYSTLDRLQEVAEPEDGLAEVFLLVILPRRANDVLDRASQRVRKVRREVHRLAREAGLLVVSGVVDQIRREHCSSSKTHF